MDRHFSDAKRLDRKFALLYLDLDGFKSVNDRFGHDAGDELLQQVAIRLREAIRSEDFAARMGGDEFTVILASVRQVAEAEQIARNILKELELPFALKAGRVFVSASIGVSVYPDHAAEVDALMKSADAAMYEAKANGKRTVAVSSA